ncbi:MAG: arginine--tRNA ligase [Ruminococcus sp.]|nr:arginine--tRNA ligase [Ruminococcus sp.]
MADLISSASEQLRVLINEALGKLISQNELPAVPLPAYSIEIPADKSHGDFAANTAMVGAKAFRMPPRKIAELICGAVDLGDSAFDRCETAGPGFINFFLGKKWFADAVSAVLDEKDSYGRSDYGAGRRVLVEFVSANPTGPMHIGNARGGAIGDCLASVLDWAGFRAEREFYVNDAGNQIEKFGRSLSLRYMQLCSDKGQQLIYEHQNSTEALAAAVYDDTGEGRSFEMPEDSYLGADIIAHAAEYYKKHIFELRDVSEEERRKALVEYALPLNIEGLERDLKKYRIVYDNWFRESTIHERNETKKVVDALLESGHAYEQDGAVWFRATEYGLDKDFVLRRSNGLYTYIVPDIAYHYDKLVTRNFDKAINVLGADHHGYVPRLKAALDALGVDSSKLEVILMQMVRLVRGGETVKLSKRSGKAITLVTLLDEIPIDAARFYFNLREADSQFEFDLDLTVEKSSQNPVYYVQYAHARICSLFRNLEQEGVSVPDSADLTLLTQPAEIELIRHIAALPGEIKLSAKALDPSKMTRYAVGLATLFHRFYDSCSVKNAETEELRNARMLLSAAALQALRNVLTMLKIDQPEKM